MSGVGVGAGAGIYKDSYNFYDLVDVDPEVFEMIKVEAIEDATKSKIFKIDAGDTALALTRNRYAGLVNAGFLSDPSEWGSGS